MTSLHTPTYQELSYEDFSVAPNISITAFWQKENWESVKLITKEFADSIKSQLPQNINTQQEQDQAVIHVAASYFGHSEHYLGKFEIEGTQSSVQIQEKWNTIREILANK